MMLISTLLALAVVAGLIAVMRLDEDPRSWTKTDKQAAEEAEAPRAKSRA